MNTLESILLCGRCGEEISQTGEPDWCNECGIVEGICQRITYIPVQSLGLSKFIPVRKMGWFEGQAVKLESLFKNPRPLLKDIKDFKKDPVEPPIYFKQTKNNNSRGNFPTGENPQDYGI